MKRIIEKIKEYWKRFKEYLIGKKPTDREKFDAIYSWIIKNKPHLLSIHCLCGNSLNYHDIEKQYAREYIWFRYYCKHCNITSEKRFSYSFEEIKN